MWARPEMMYGSLVWVGS